MLFDDGVKSHCKSLILESKLSTKPYLLLSRETTSKVDRGILISHAGRQGDLNSYYGTLKKLNNWKCVYFCGVK